MTKTQLLAMLSDPSTWKHAALYLIIYAVYAVWLMRRTWEGFLAVMLLQARLVDQTLPPDKWTMGFGKVTVTLGVLYDVLCNLTVMSVILMEFPREFMVTSRVTRLSVSGILDQADGKPLSWKQRVAMQMCGKMLNFADYRKKHCQ